MIFSVTRIAIAPLPVRRSLPYAGGRRPDRPHRWRTNHPGILPNRARKAVIIVGWLNVLTEMGGDLEGPHGEEMAAIIGRHWPASTVGPVTDFSPDGRGLQLPR